MRLGAPHKKPPKCCVLFTVDIALNYSKPAARAPAGPRDIGSEVQICYIKNPVER